MNFKEVLWKTGSWGFWKKKVYVPICLIGLLFLLNIIYTSGRINNIKNRLEHKKKHMFQEAVVMQYLE